MILLLALALALTGAYALNKWARARHPDASPGRRMGIALTALVFGLAILFAVVFVAFVATGDAPFYRTSLPAR